MFMKIEFPFVTDNGKYTVNVKIQAQYNGV